MDPLQMKAELAEERDDFEGALKSWKELAIREREPLFFLRYGRSAQKLGCWQEAENALAQGLRLDPSSSLIMENIGSLWANRLDKQQADSLETAKEWFMRALEIERNAPLLTQLGVVYERLSDEGSARGAFEEAVEVSPDYEEALYNLAVLEEAANPARSAQLLERAIQIDPDYGVAHQVLGRLYQRQKDLPRAEYHFRRCLEIDPSDYWSNLYLANLLGSQGMNVEADHLYRFATNLHPEMVGGLEIFSRFLESIGKEAEAAEVRRQAKLQADRRGTT